MGCSPFGGRFFVDLFCAMETVAAGALMVAEVSAPDYSASGLTDGFVFAQVSSLQTNAHVRYREADQRRRFLGLGESLVSLGRADGTRLSLLVAALAHNLRLVGGQKPGVVQTFFSRVLPGSGDHRAIFYLGAATTAADCCGINELPSNCDRSHRQLLLLQFADDRVVLAADR